MKSELICKIGRAVGKSKLFIQAKSPEILIGVGVISGIGCLAAAIIETHKYADDILNSHKKAIDQVKETREKYPDEYSKKDEVVDTVIAWAETGKDVARAYWPTAALGALSVASTLAAYKIVSNRYAAMLVSYTTLKEAFERYRKRVVKEYGEEMDRHFLLGTKKDVISVKTDDGEEIETSEIVSNEDIKLSDTQYLFSKETSLEWESDVAYDLSFLRGKQSRWDDYYHSHGYLLLNKVLDDLGINETNVGAKIGWFSTKDRENDHIDFGIKSLRDEYGRPMYLLDFNCHGEVYQLIDRANKNRKRELLLTSSGATTYTESLKGRYAY